MEEARIQLFTGAYGSGKTEVSMNHAVYLCQNYDQVGLIDLDIVNPYFRSREAAVPLRDAGVDVIFPQGQLATADLPALSPEILRVLQDPRYRVIFDVGGDDVGAVALGRFQRYFLKENYEMNFVINTLRPFTKDFTGIKEIMDEVSQASRLQVTHLIANVNLAEDTRVEDILTGYSVIKEVSKKLELPIKYVAVEESLRGSSELEKIKEPIRWLHLYNRPNWLQQSRNKQ